jgi:hypothetical protein
MLVLARKVSEVIRWHGGGCGCGRELEGLKWKGVCDGSRWGGRQVLSGDEDLGSGSKLCLRFGVGGDGDAVDGVWRAGDDMAQRRVEDS